MRIGVLVAVLAWAGAVAGAPPYGHSVHGPAFDSGPRLRATLQEGQGRCHFPVTATADAQAFFDQGVAQFHGFHWYESERSFREALARDPQCVMALWGMAMVANGDVWFHKPVPRARALLDAALKLRQARVKRGAPITAREDLYVNALVKLLYTGDAAAGRRAGLDLFREIVRTYPDDVEAKAFLTFELLKNDDLYKPPGSNWLTRPSEAFLREADALVDAIFAAQSDHPAHHYKIHIWDFLEPERAVASTDPCGLSEPRIAHMWHMSGHIHWRARRFAEAAWQQEASARTDHRYYREQRVMPFLNPNYLHNNDWLTETLGCLGRLREAVELALNMIALPRHPRYAAFATSSGVRGRDDLMDVLALSERWNDVARLVDSPALVPTADVSEETKRLRLRGLAHYHLGQRAALDADVREIAALRTPLAPLATARALPEGPGAAPPSSPRTAADVAGNVQAQREAWLEVSAYAALLSGDVRKAREKLAKLEPLVQPPIDWEDRRRGLLEHQLAQAFAAAGDRGHALVVARRAAASYPGEVVPQAVLVELLAQAGKRDEARREFERLTRSATQADRDLPVLVRLERQHGLRLPPATRVVAWRRPEMHPALETLGPKVWEPVDAPDFAVTDAAGQRHALADYRGKAVLVVLNLGRGCAHCNAQLEGLTAATPAFGRIGVDVLVVTDERDRSPERGVRPAPAYPFPVAAASRHDVFRAFRAIDAFEDQPLHGAYLIGPDGKLLWEDVNAEPFVDFGFLTVEAARLLQGRRSPVLR